MANKKHTHTHADDSPHTDTRSQPSVKPSTDTFLAFPQEPITTLPNLQLWMFYQPPETVTQSFLIAITKNSPNSKLITRRLGFS